jgi:uncharacterized protein YcbK (DUF882 family)
MAAAPALAVVRPREVRSIALHNLHTGERIRIEYWHAGRYIPAALRQIDTVLRDHRNDEVHPMEPELIDLLAMLARKLQASAPFEVISGYRSPASNAVLARQGHGVVENSLHVRGMAVDVRVPRRRLAAVRDAAIALQVGGVGYYPRSDFVHVDTGRVRRW